MLGLGEEETDEGDLRCRAGAEVGQQQVWEMRQQPVLMYVSWMPDQRVSCW